MFSNCFIHIVLVSLMRLSFLKSRIESHMHSHLPRALCQGGTVGFINFILSTKRINLPSHFQIFSANIPYTWAHLPSLHLYLCKRKHMHTHTCTLLSVILTNAHTLSHSLIYIHIHTLTSFYHSHASLWSSDSACRALAYRQCQKIYNHTYPPKLLCHIIIKLLH